MKSTILFFDDCYLSRRENLDRHVGQPVPVSEGTFRDPFLDVQWGYPSVFWDEEHGNWRCLYQGRLSDAASRTQHAAVVIESDDGIHWRLNDVSTLAPDIERSFPHQVLPLAGFSEWGPCYFDEYDDKSRRIKGFGSPSNLYVSPDGFRWTLQDGVKWHPWGIDPAVSAFWNKYRNSYVIAARPVAGDRRIAVYETEDWVSYTSPELALQADALDTPAAEVYGMPVFPYEDMFVGLLWIFHTTPLVRSNPGKFHYGKVDCQLAYSYDGKHFSRGLREPFFENPPPGEYGSGCIYPSSLVRLDREQKLRIYSSSTKLQHAQVFLLDNPQDHDALLLHELRSDGFVYLESQRGPGSLITRILYYSGGELSLNAEVPYGKLLVQITDVDGDPIEGYSFRDCLPITGDSTSFQPKWKNTKTLSALSGQAVRIEIELTNGRLYAVRGDFVLPSPRGLREYRETGKTPKPVQSFYLDNVR